MTVSNGSYFLSVGRIKTPSTILGAARHNLREIQAEIGAGEGIDATRMHLNRVLMNTPMMADEVAAVESKIRRASKPQQANGVRGVEVLIGLNSGTPIDMAAFFLASVEWCEKRYAVPLLSAVTHNDEAHPHTHAIFLPIRDGKWIGSDLIGGPKELHELQRDYHRDIASAFGLNYRVGAGKAAGPAKARIDATILDRMFADATPPQGKRRDEVLRAIGKNRTALAKVYGVSARTFAEIVSTPQPCI